MLLSADVGGFRFDEFDDGRDEFCEFSESTCTNYIQSKGNMKHFLKPVFISPTFIESHSFEKFCGNGLAAVDWFLPLTVEV